MTVIYLNIGKICFNCLEYGGYMDGVKSSIKFTNFAKWCVAGGGGGSEGGAKLSITRDFGGFLQSGSRPCRNLAIMIYGCGVIFEEIRTQASSTIFLSFLFSNIAEFVSVRYHVSCSAWRDVRYCRNIWIIWSWSVSGSLVKSCRGQQEQASSWFGCPLPPPEMAPGMAPGSHLRQFRRCKYILVTVDRGVRWMECKQATTGAVLGSGKLGEWTEGSWGQQQQPRQFPPELPHTHSRPLNSPRSRIHLEVFTCVPPQWQPWWTGPGKILSEVPPSGVSLQVAVRRGISWMQRGTAAADARSIHCLWCSRRAPWAARVRWSWWDCGATRETTTMIIQGFKAPRATPTWSAALGRPVTVIRWLRLTGELDATTACPPRPWPWWRRTFSAHWTVGVPRWEPLSTGSCPPPRLASGRTHAPTTPAPPRLVTPAIPSLRGLALNLPATPWRRQEPSFPPARGERVSVHSPPPTPAGPSLWWGASRATPASLPPPSLTWRKKKGEVEEVFV